jgi:DNA-binding transcriptional MocR family regulator
MNSAHDAAVAEVLAAFDEVMPALRPEAAELLEFARRAFQAELPKRASARKARRGDLIRYVANTVFRPDGLSDRRIAEKIYKLALRINPDREYLAEPKASISKLIRLNGGVPSEETIRRDLR